MTDAYILKDREVVPSTFSDWASWFERAGRDGSRIIKKTDLPGDVRVSTVFIGLSGELFETMIFGGPHDQEYQERCDTYEGALEQHEKAVAAASQSSGRAEHE